MEQSTLPPTPPKSPSPLRQAQKVSNECKNPVLFEAFEWYSKGDHKHWRRLRAAVPQLAAIGITRLWLPPGSKAKDAESNGYDIYDAYDLGEFDQKGTIPTKWGTKQDLVDLSAECQRQGVGLIWDAILNHRAFADSTEMVKVVEVDPRDRTIDTTPPFEIEAWTNFQFSARRGKYSTFTYNKSHFNGTDWDQQTGKRAIYRFIENNKTWAQDVGKLQGNADYLMLENLDYSNAAVVQEALSWGQWIMQEVQLSGFRLDAVQHYSWRFADMWTQHLQKANKANGNVNGNGNETLLCVGEFWHGDVNVLLEWLNNMNPDFKLYDVPLLYKLARLSQGEDTDLRCVFQGTLVEARPNNAVTFLHNHDTQKDQAMYTPINPAFTPHAHCLLLLRRAGHPCVFFGDVYGIAGPFPEPPSCAGKLPDIVLARKLYAYGAQIDYFKSSECIGWMRVGDSEHGDG
ncbi:glycoside hydrolase family 13 protein, partial [Plenodomus tracheiphilus IPT5]